MTDYQRHVQNRNPGLLLIPESWLRFTNREDLVRKVQLEDEWQPLVGCFDQDRIFDAFTFRGFHSFGVSRSTPNNPRFIFGKRNPRIRLSLAKNKRSFLWGHIASLRRACG